MAQAGPATESSVTDGLTSAIDRHLDRVGGLLRGIDPHAVAAVARVLRGAREAGRTVFTLGNGGSAATAMHFANDLVRVTSTFPPPLRVLCLTGNTSIVSALANDHGYDQIFVRQLGQWLEPGDVVVGISASGSSPNCVEALRFSAAHGAVNVGLLGFDGGAMKELCDVHLHVPCHDYPAVEDLHLVLSHALACSLAPSSSPQSLETPGLEAPGP